MFGFLARETTASQKFYIYYIELDRKTRLLHTAKQGGGVIAY